jgi:hypothetical protein
VSSAVFDRHLTSTVLVVLIFIKLSLSFRDLFVTSVTHSLSGLLLSRIQHKSSCVTHTFTAEDQTCENYSQQMKTNKQYHMIDSDATIILSVEYITIQMNTFLTNVVKLIEHYGV